MVFGEDRDGHCVGKVAAEVVGWENASKEPQPRLCSSNCHSHYCPTMALCSSGIILNLPCVICKDESVRASVPIYELYSPGPWQEGLWVLLPVLW